MSGQLFDLCKLAFHCSDNKHRNELFHEIEQWLRENHGNRMLLWEEAMYKAYDKSMPLHWLVSCGCPPVTLVQRFIEIAPFAVKEPTNTYNLSLHLACQNKGTFIMVKILLEAYPESISVQNIYGCTPLHLACANYGSPEVIQLLVKAGHKNLEVKDSYGALPLNWACKSSSACYSSDVIMILLEAFPQGVQSQDKDGDFPLHNACLYKATPSVIKMLLEAYPQAAGMQDKYHMIPLQYACSNKASFEVVSMLLDAYPEGAEMVQHDDCQESRDLVRKTKIPLHRLAWYGMSSGDCSKSKDKDKIIAHDDLLDKVDPYPNLNDSSGMIYIHNKTDRVIQVKQVIMVQPNQKVPFHIPRDSCGGIFDVACADDDSLGWAKKMFVRRGCTQDITGEPKESLK